MADRSHDCEHISSLLEGYVLKHLDEAGMELVRRHLEECAECRTEESFIKELGYAVYDLERAGKGYHPSAAVLIQIASDEVGADVLDPGERVCALEHIKSCKVCRDTLETLQTVNADLAKADPNPAEQALIDQIVASQRMSVRLREWLRVRLGSTIRRPVFAAGLAAACIAIVAVGLYLRQPTQPSVHLAKVPTWQGLMEQGQALATAGEADSANALADRAITAGLTQYAKSKSTVPVRLYRDGIGHTYYFQSKADAENLFSRSVSIKEQSLGRDNLQVAAALADLGAVYMQNGKSQDAQATLARALAIRQQALPPNDPDIGRSLRDLGDAYFFLHDLKQAETLFRDGLAVLEKSLGPDHPDVAIALIGVGKAVGTQWRHTEAEPFYKGAVDIERKALAPGDPDLAGSINRLANLYKQLARYSEAERLFAEALVIREETLDPTDPDLAMSYDNLAGIRERQGRPAEAETLYAKAIEVRKAGLGPDHPDVGAGYHYLGNIAMELGRYNEAEAYYKQGLKLREKLGRNHPDVATSLTDIAAVNEMQGKYAQAEKLYKRALSIREKGLVEAQPGVVNPGVAMSLDNLAALYTREHKYGEAGPLYARALSIWEKSVGPGHPATASALEAASVLYRLEGKGALALDAAGRAAAIRYDNLARNASGMTEEDALTYSQFMRYSVGNYLTCLLQAKSTDQAKVVQAADLIFRTKGQVSDEIFERQRQIVRSTDPAVQSLVESLRFSKGQLAELVFQGAGGELAVYQARLDSLERQVGRTETELAQRSADFSRALSCRDVGATRLASLLPGGSTLVEYVKFDYGLAEPDSTVPHYLALVLRGDGTPAITDLGEAAKIDALVMKYHDHMSGVAKTIEAGGAGQVSAPTQASEDAYKQMSSDLYAAVWRPIEQYTKPNELVLIAPDGALGTIPFAALTDEGGKYLIESLPVHYLASGRDLIRLEDPVKPGMGLFALGDPDYSASVAVRLEKIAPEEESRIQLAALTRALTRNVRSACKGMEDLPPTPSLPGTRAEVEKVASRWARYALGPEVVCFGAGASEERFKADAPGKRVVHLATHGFFLDEACGREAGAGPEVVGDNPLLLSGLLLAGANLRGLGADVAGAEDGILTAYEISGMNLEGTQLVVLSACETGLGKVRDGEGVYGLRRSFQMAGARTVVSALWNISDADGATAALMAGLYDRKGESLPQTIRRIQLDEIKALRRQGAVDHPYTWGAFIATGDWR